jgi:P27 family predicted phage terminase small subunit
MKAPSLPSLTTRASEEEEDEVKIPQPPRGRGTEFVKRWREYVLIMHEVGTLLPRYYPALEMLCDAHQQIVLADAVLATDGTYMVSEKGTVMAHPACVRRESAKREVLKYQQELCLTPATGGKAANIKKSAGQVPVAGR